MPGSFLCSSVQVRLVKWIHLVCDAHLSRRVQPDTPRVQEKQAGFRVVRATSLVRLSQDPASFVTMRGDDRNASE